MNSGMVYVARLSDLLSEAKQDLVDPEELDTFLELAALAIARAFADRLEEWHNEAGAG